MNENGIGDRMNPRERRARLSAGEPVDRIPCVLLLGETACHFVGASLAQYRHSAKIMAEVEVATYALLGHDGVGAGPGYSGLAEAMGVELEFPENSIPYPKEPVIRQWADLEKIQPIDARRDGKMPLYLDALAMIEERLGDEVPVGTFIGGPITTAGYLRGTDVLLRDMIRNPEMAHRLMEVVTLSALQYIDLMCGLGYAISIADPSASGSMISPDLFREFVKPYLSRYVERVVEISGTKPMLHICGDTHHIWNDMVETGAGTLSLDNIIDLAEAKKAVGDSVCLMGNIRPVDTIQRGTKELIFAEVRDCIQKMYDSPKGFVLSSGCQVPAGVPKENLVYFMEATRLYGRWPVRPDSFEE